MSTRETRKISWTCRAYLGCQQSYYPIVEEDGFDPPRFVVEGTGRFDRRIRVGRGWLLEYVLIPFNLGRRSPRPRRTEGKPNSEVGS